MLEFTEEYLRKNQSITNSSVATLKSTSVSDEDEVAFNSDDINTTHNDLLDNLRNRFTSFNLIFANKIILNQTLLGNCCVRFYVTARDEDHTLMLTIHWKLMIHGTNSSRMCIAFLD